MPSPRAVRYLNKTSAEARQYNARNYIDAQWSVDDLEEPNVYPYKKCSVCSERSSCGNYNEDKKWVCEGCAEDEDEGADSTDEEQSVCQMRGKDEPRCGSDVFLCGFNKDQWRPGCVCLGE